MPEREKGRFNSCDRRSINFYFRKEENYDTFIQIRGGTKVTSKRLVCMILAFSLVLTSAVAMGFAQRADAASSSKCQKGGSHSYTYSFKKFNGSQHYRYKTCKKCGKHISTEKLKHQFGRTTTANSGKKTHCRTRICKLCGYIDKWNEYHSYAKYGKTWKCEYCGRKK